MTNKPIYLKPLSSKGSLSSQHAPTHVPRPYSIIKTHIDQKNNRIRVFLLGIRILATNGALKNKGLGSLKFLTINSTPLIPRQRAHAQNTKILHKITLTTNH